MGKLLEGKVALVTGSSDGIGKAIALAFANQGANVVINGRRPESGMKVVEEARKAGVEAAFEKADINNYSEVEQMVKNSINHFGKIDILVATGAAAPGPLPNFFREVNPDEYLEFAKVHWANRLYCIRAVLDHMIAQGGGRMITVTTDAGRWPTPGESMPGSAGAALVMSTKVLANEFSRWNIFLNTISLTVTKNTPGAEWVLSASAIRKVFQKALQRQAFPVYPEQVAELALFLASGKSDPMTGQIFSINGGVCFPG